MESNGHVNVPLRTGKKMKKRKELDALVANSVNKRSCAPKRVGCGISSQDQLLSESTDEQEYWVAGANKRPRARIARRRACNTIFRACSAFLMFACVVATSTVLWLFIDVREQITALRSELDQVVASTQGVPDALQKCHTISKNLQQNQTIILGQIADLKLQMENLSKDVANVQSELNKIEKKLSSTPEYVNIPRQMSEVSDSVANLGSQIKDLTATVSALKDFKNKFETVNNVLSSNVTDLRQSITRLQNVSQLPVSISNKSETEIVKISTTLEELKANVTSLNSTLSNKIQWLHEDQIKDHNTVDLLSETGQNISARVTTLEGICSKCSSDEITIRTDVNEISKELTTLQTKLQTLSTQLPALESQYRELSKNHTQLETKLDNFLSRTSTDSHPDSPSLKTSSAVPPVTTTKETLVTTTAKPATQVSNSKPPVLQIKSTN